ncbi:MAG: hypothetical protein OSB41_05660 [Kiritimatiellae bacterium]|nr:hypothetical protein [Kiritimatiellia bacterium]
MTAHNETIVKDAFDQGDGVLRLAPNWVPRSFCIPGRRIKLHPDDYYALGGERGGIDERWFASTTPAENGPLTGKEEGLSQIVFGDQQVTLREAVDVLKGDVLGRRLWDEHQSWPMYSKFFDNKGPLPHHVHHRDEHAALVGQNGKPEAYYFPPQVNNYGADYPYTFFGFEPGTKPEQVLECLKNFPKGDNKITNLSKAYRLQPGTGWDVPPGILHAPGSLCTYEPQKASDVFAMYQSLVNHVIVPEALLWKDTPQDRLGDHDYLMEVLDWEANVDPNFVDNHFMEPRPLHSAYSAKELTVLPGRTVTIKDAACYGMIMMQGHGTMGVWDIETPTMIRFGQLSHDEYFVSESAAQEGLTIANLSKTDPIVMLKHFGPGNPDLK